MAASKTEEWAAKVKAKQDAAAKSAPSRSAAKPAKESDEKPRVPPPNIEAYYESGKGCYWTVNGRGHWQRFTTDEMTRLLKINRYSAKTFDGQSASEVEHYLYRIAFHQSVDFAGELAGWETGIHDIAGHRILVTKSRVRPERAKGEFPILRAFIKSLLGDQAPYFLGWLKGCLKSLDDGYPFRPGQMVCLAGKRGCGKSFLQLLITSVLGGRVADPCPFLAGDTNFTGDLGRCEHLMVEDKALKDMSNAKRRHFGANIKSFVANQHQRIRAMHKEAFLVPIFTRLTLSVNDNPSALAILPPLDEDISDKIMLFYCHNAELPSKKDKSIEWPEQWAMVQEELPAFVDFLYRYRVPESVLDPDRRFYVRAYHSDQVTWLLEKMSSEEKLLYLIEMLDLPWQDGGVREGTAAEIEQWITKADHARKLERILTHQNTMGVLLSNIARHAGEERVQIIEHGRKLIYRISKEEL